MKVRLTLIFLLALALRWAYALHFPADVFLTDVDARGYHQLARNLLDGRGFSINSEPPYLSNTIRTPVYPLFVTGIYCVLGRQALGVALVQGVLDAGTCLVLWALVRRWTKSELGASLAAALYALNPTAWRFSDSLLGETLLTLLLTCLALVFIQLTEAAGPKLQIGKSILMGVLCGLAILVKPNALVLPIWVAVCLGIGRGGAWRCWLKQAAVVLAAAALVVGPWCVRNWVVTGRLMLSSAFEDNLSHVSAVATLARVQSEEVAPWTARWEAIYGTLIAEAARRYDWPSGAVRSAREADQRQQQLAAVAREIILRYPAEFAFSHLSGFLRSWVPQEHRFWYEFFSGQAWDTLGTAEGAAGQTLQRLQTDGIEAALRFLWQERFAKLPPLAFLLWAGWILVYLLSAMLLGVGSWHLRAKPACLSLVWGSVLCLTFLPGPIAYVRFRVPVEPLLIAVMAAGIVALLRPSIQLGIFKHPVRGQPG